MLYSDQSALLGGHKGKGKGEGEGEGEGGGHILRGAGATPCPPSRHAPGAVTSQRHLATFSNKSTFL